jgi:hypothetical protein
MQTQIHPTKKKKTEANDKKWKDKKKLKKTKKKLVSEAGASCGIRCTPHRSTRSLKCMISLGYNLMIAHIVHKGGKGMNAEVAALADPKTPTRERPSHGAWPRRRAAGWFSPYSTRRS